MTRSLITRGCGFIGRYLTLELLEKGHEVTLFDIATDEAFVRRAGWRPSRSEGNAAAYAGRGHSRFRVYGSRRIIPRDRI